MSSLTLVSPLASRKPGEYPLSPFVHIGVGDAPSLSGQAILSPQLMTEHEVDHAINLLVAELEKLRLLAKLELRTLQAKLLAR